MASGNEAAVVIIKRRKKGGHAHHHGGAWKVAYADFVTAMMAFFLLLWLLNATTEIQKQGISDYFSPSTVSRSQGGAGGMLGGRAIATPGAMTVRTVTPSVSLNIEPNTGATEGRADEDGGASDQDRTADPAIREAIEKTAAERERAERERDDARFDEVEQTIRLAVQEIPELKDLHQHLVIDRTPEGLRIQIVDQEGKPMFPSGSARMLERTQMLVQQLARAVAPLPNKVTITGHTDAVPFRGGPRGYSNWELSGDRAQTTRRILTEAGLDLARVSAVAGRADREPLVPDDPNSPRNRRISIVLLHNTQDGVPPAASRPATEAPRELKQDWTGPRVR